MPNYFQSLTIGIALLGAALTATQQQNDSLSKQNNYNVTLCKNSHSSLSTKEEKTELQQFEITIFLHDTRGAHGIELWQY